MTENPYEPTLSLKAASKPTIPHTSSVRAEAWRGFKFGAKITGFVMAVIVATVGLTMLGMTIHAIVINSGAVLSKANYLVVAKGIGVSLFIVMLFSFYGGIAGAIIMMIGAVVRKQRVRRIATKVG